MKPMTSNELAEAQAAAREAAEKIRYDLDERGIDTFGISEEAAEELLTSWARIILREMAGFDL